MFCFQSICSLPKLLKCQHIGLQLAVADVTAKNLYLLRATHIISFADTKKDHGYRPVEEERKEWLLGGRTRKRLMGERV